MEDDYDYDAPLSPASSDGLSDDGSTCSSDEGSLISSCSTIDEEDDDFFEPPEIHTPPPQEEGSTAIFDAEDSRMVYPQEFANQYPGAIPEPMQPLNMPAPSCAPKFNMPFWGEMFKYLQPAPIHHHNPFPFHPQVHMFSPIPGF